MWQSLVEFRSVTSEGRRSKKERTRAKYNDLPCIHIDGHVFIPQSYFRVRMRNHSDYVIGDLLGYAELQLVPQQLQAMYCICRSRCFGDARSSPASC